MAEQEKSLEEKLEAAQIALAQERQSLDSLRTAVGPIVKLLTENDNPERPVKIEVSALPPPDPWTYLQRFTGVLGALASIAAVSGLVFTALSYGDTANQLAKALEREQAKTVYDLSTQGRELADRLDSGDAGTGEAINYYHTVFGLMQTDIIDEGLRTLMLLDMCSLTKTRGDFVSTWSQLEIYYPKQYRDLIGSFLALGECADESTTPLKKMEDISDKYFR